MPLILEEGDFALPPLGIVEAKLAKSTGEKIPANEMAAEQPPQDEGGVACAEKEIAVGAVDVHVTGDGADGAGYKTQPPSPPESGASTPTLRIAPCPLRLKPYYPPINYGNTEDQSIYRSAFPLERNLDFLDLLGIRSVLCLVDTEPTAAYSEWILKRDIQRYRVDIAANKDGKVKTTFESVYEALVILGDSANHPVHIHCNQGKHRTGCVIACFRKVQGWSLTDVIGEYMTYAQFKVRPDDIKFIRSFNPDAFIDHLKRTGRHDDSAFMERLHASIAGVGALTEAPSDESTTDSHLPSLSSQASTLSDEDVDVVPAAMKDESSALTSCSPDMLTRMPSRPSPPAPMGDSDVTIDGPSFTAINVGNHTLLDPALSSDGVATCIVELDEDALTPPAELSNKMLGSPGWRSYDQHDC